MPTIVALVIGAERRRALGQHLGAEIAIRFCDTVDALVQLVLEQPVAVVLGEPRDRHGISVGNGLPVLRAQAPNLPIFILCDPADRALEDIQALAVLGGHLGLIWHSGDQQIGALVHAFLNAPSPYAPNAAEAILERFLPLVHDDIVRRFLIFAAVNSSAALTVEQAAEKSGIGQQKLERHLRVAGMREPRFLLYGAAGLHGAGWLAHQHWSSAQVATVMQLTGPKALGRLLKRYHGVTLSAVQSPGVVAEMVDKFVSAARTRRPRPAVATDDTTHALRFRTGRHVVTSRRNDPVRIFDLESGSTVTLSEWAGRAWRLLRLGITVGDVIDILQRRYEVDREWLAASVVATVEQLRKEGLIRLDHG